jgi:hypothetical protein
MRMDRRSHGHRDREWVVAKKVKAGDRLFTDGGFTCMPGGELKVVREDGDGLYVACRDGRHYLDGQLDEQGRLVGFYNSGR